MIVLCWQVGTLSSGRTCKGYGQVPRSLSPDRVMSRHPPRRRLVERRLPRMKVIHPPGRTHTKSKMPPTRPFHAVCPTSPTPTPQILEAWEATGRREQGRKRGDSGVTRATLLSSSLEERPAAAPSSGTADGFEGSQNGAQAKDAGSEAIPTLRLPKPNPFIPSEFAIKEAPAAAPASSPGVDEGQGGQHPPNKPCPRRVVRESAAGAAAAAAGVVSLTLWHLQDRTFVQPRAEMYLQVTRV